MALGNVVDKLHDEHRLTHASATEQANLTTFHIRLQQVDHLDTRSQDFLLRRQFLKRRSLAVDGVSPLHVELFHTIDRLTDNVQHSTFNLIASGHQDG